MEKYKAKYLKAFIDQRAKIKMEDLKHFVKGLEERVRQCYEETITLSGDDFVSMILIDASFIIELFLRNSLNEWTPEDRIVLKPWLAARMQLDFILLENQLPFFIFDELFEKVASRPGSTSFVNLSFEYFQNINRHRQKMSDDPELKILHFVDLLRNFYLPPHRPLPSREFKIVEHIMHSASQQHGVGLKFEVDLSSNCLLDLELDYKKKVFKIPRFTLDNNTELYVRNILALEQCHYPYMTYVTDYFILLDFLINTQKDVNLLHRQGIMVNGFGKKHATNFINDLCTGIIYSTELQILSSLYRFEKILRGPFKWLDGFLETGLFWVSLEDHFYHSCYSLVDPHFNTNFVLFYLCNSA